MPFIKTIYLGHKFKNVPIIMRYYGFLNCAELTRMLAIVSGGKKEYANISLGISTHTHN